MTLLRCLKIVIGILVLLTTVMPCGTVSAKMVRVAVYNIPGFQEKEADGLFHGYNIQYLNRLADEENWELQYIQKPTWEDCQRAVKEGEADIVAPARRIPSREADFAFSNMSIGTEYGGLIALKARDDLYYEDEDMLPQLTYGCVSNAVFETDFKAYAGRRGFTPEIKYYDSVFDLLDALAREDIDAAVANLAFSGSSHLKVIDKLSSAPYYYMVRKEDTELLKEVNEGLARLKENSPNLQSELNLRFNEFYNVLPLTKAEQEYINSAPTIRVACPIGIYPITYRGFQSHEPEGIAKTVLRRITADTGLQFEFVNLPNGEINADRDYDVTAFVDEKYSSVVREEGFIATHAYFRDEMVFLGQRDRDIAATDDNRVSCGYVKTGHVDLAALQRTLSQYKFKPYNTNVECFEALKNNEVDRIMTNRYASNYFFNKPQYADFVVVPAPVVEISVCYGVSKRADPRLKSIINKGIVALGRRGLSDVVLECTTANVYNPSVLDMFFKYRFFIIGVFFILLMVGTGLNYVNHLRERNLKLARKVIAQQQSEQELLIIKANRDTLTGLYNKQAFYELAGLYLSEASAEGYALIFFDLDNFKSVNDNLGHLMGDAVIKDVANKLQTIFRAEDIKARFGGDEFCILVKAIPRAALKEKLELVNKMVRKEYTNDQAKVPVSCSMGVVYSANGGHELEEMVRYADEALYRAKSQGKDSFVFYDSIEAEPREGKEPAAKA